MGWLKHILLGDLGQSLDIVGTKEALRLQSNVNSQHSRKALSQDQQIAQLKARSERLHLAITALSRFLIDKDLINEDELDSFIKAIDEEDGELDGRLSMTDPSLKPKLVIPPKDD